MTIQENIDQLFDKFENFIKNKTVIGEPFQVGDITLIPTLSITFGLGTGGGSDPRKGQQSSGSGTGMGSRVVPIAMIVIKNGEISILPIKKNTGLDKLLDMVPDLMDKIKDVVPDPKKKEDKKD